MNKILFQSLLILLGLLLFASCGENQETISKSANYVPSTDISIPLHILYIDAAELDALVCIGPQGNPCPNCRNLGNRPTQPQPNKPQASRGNLLLKYVISGRTLNFLGWSFDLKNNPTQDFDSKSNIQFKIGRQEPGIVANDGTELGDLIWGYKSLAWIHCLNQDPATRKKYIVLIPQNDGSQIKWTVCRSDDDPASIDFKCFEDGPSLKDLQDYSPNPIPPKSMNTEWGDN